MAYVPPPPGQHIHGHRLKTLPNFIYTTVKLNENIFTFKKKIPSNGTGIL